MNEVYEPAQSQGFEIVYALSDEPRGLRRFFVCAPLGKVINILSHIPQMRAKITAFLNQQGRYVESGKTPAYLAETFIGNLERFHGIMFGCVKTQ